MKVFGQVVQEIQNNNKSITSNNENYIWREEMILRLKREVLGGIDFYTIYFFYNRS